MNREKKNTEALEHIVLKHVFIASLLQSSYLALLISVGLLLQEAAIGKDVIVEIRSQTLKHL